jgi:acyl-coenzyme A synthetase/AMP-(fatty) acid ligase
MHPSDESPFAFERHGDAVALICADSTLSYGALGRAVAESAQGIGADDLVAVVAAADVASLVAYLACQRVGRPVLLVDAQLPAERRLDLYDRYQVSVVFDGQWRRLRPTGPQTHPELSLLLSTSGSTGAPKMVRLSRAAVHANASAIARYLSLRADDVAITSLPFHYSYGLSVVHSHLLVGGSIVVADLAVTQREFWELVRSRKVSNLAGVPVIYEWMRRLRVERMELPALRMLTQAGGRLAPDLVRWWAEAAGKKGWEFFVMYGQTEATARMAYLPPQLAAHHSDAIGLPIPGGAFALVGEGGEILEGSDQEGELVFTGVNVMMGYAMEAADLARGDELGGVLHTGDIAARDSSGVYRIVGRKSRFLKVFGKRLALDHLEALLAERGLTVVVTGRDDFLIVVADDVRTADAAAVAVCDLAGLHRSVVNSMTMNEIPRTSSGKLNYAEIIATFDRRRQEMHTTGQL